MDVVDVDTMPTEIRNLVIPNPKDVLIYSACAGHITSLTLFAYIKDRYRLHSKMCLEEVQEKLRSSKDRHWINLKKHGDTKAAVN